MSSSTINTADPIALRYLMTETVFGISSEPARKLERTPQFPFYGKNEKKYLFLTDEKQHEWMPQAAMDAFIKTLAALKLAENDVALLNLAKLAGAPSVDQLTSFFKPKVVVNLGTAFVWPEQGDVNVFHTHTFSDMLADAEKKRVFWTTIKRLLI